MTKYKLHRHDSEIHKDLWIFPLSVQIYLNHPGYTEKNINISVHFLCFHARWLFMEVEDGNDD
jgi:hypothetical protein